jgi:hypothetical protein
MYDILKDLMHAEDHSNDDIRISDYPIIQKTFYKNIDRNVESFSPRM